MFHQPVIIATYLGRVILQLNDIKTYLRLHGALLSCPTSKFRRVQGASLFK